MRSLPRTHPALSVLAVALALAVTRAAPADRVDVRAPLRCSRGPDSQHFAAVVTMPAVAHAGARFTVRIDGLPSGTLSHFGLFYVFDMRTDYSVAGAQVVPGSPRVVAGTGTSNVRATARVWLDSAGVHTLLPARVDNGQGYTSPSLEFEVTVDAPAGAAVRVQLVHYEIGALVALLGRISTACHPSPALAALGTTRVVEAQR